MKVWTHPLLAAALAVAAFTLPALAQGATGTTTLSVVVGPEASITVSTATTTLSKADITFGSFTGTTLFTYKMRTKKASGTGSITAKLDEFVGLASGVGPKVVTDLRYSSVSAFGTIVTTATPSITAGTNVLTFGTNFHTATAGNSASVAWTLGDDPVFETDTYSSLVTFTIAAP